MDSAAFPTRYGKGIGSVLLGAACAGLLSTPAFARDQVHPTSENHISGVRFDVHADIGGYVSAGAGFRADIPLIATGLLANSDDELAFSLGADAYFVSFYHQYYDGGAYVVPSAVLQWNLYLGPKWSIFPEAGVAVYIGDGDTLPRGLPVYAALDLGIGARLHFSPRNSLLLRVNRPTGLQVGVTF